MRFNPPPGWPPAPAGWVPAADWRPDPSWGPAPDGWVFWVETGGHGRRAAYATRRGDGRGAHAISLVVVVVMVMALGAGAVTVFNLLTAAPTVDGVQRAASREEALGVLDDTYGNAVIFLEENHGFEKSRVRAALDEHLQAGRAGDTIYEVEMQTSSILRELETMWTAAAVWNDIWGGKPAFTDNRSGTEFEAILDEYTNGTVDFAIDSACDDLPKACVKWTDPNVVHLTELYIGNPGYSQNYTHTLLHEYAHVVQMKYWLEVEPSADYTALFDQNIEYQADCMALAVKPDFVSSYDSACSAEQLESATAIWDGVVH